MPVAGPTAALVLARALERRTREAWLIALGAAVPEGLYAALACWGVSAILERFPRTMSFARVAAGVLLAAVGAWLLLRASAVATSRPRSGGAERGLLVGVLTTLVNPTLALTWSVAVGALHSLGFLAVGTRVAPSFGLGVALGVVGWFAVMIRLVRLVQNRLRAGLLVDLVRAVGALLLGAGVVATARAVALTP